MPLIGDLGSGWDIAGFLLKALTYAAALIGAGGALFLAIFPDLNARERQQVAKITAGIAVLGAMLTAAAVPVQAASLSGAGLSGMFEPMFLNMLLGSPVGTSVLVRLLGLGLVAVVILRRTAAYWVGALGAVLTVVSFAITGHTASFEPRLLGGVLVAVHLLAVAYWIGALWPLVLVSGAPDTARAARILERFGTLAMGFVGALVVAGGLLAWRFLGGVSALWQTQYGNMFSIKLTVFAVLLILAALNRFRLVPQIAAGAPGAGRALRRSIGMEIAAVLLILLITATFTTYSSPF
jgi:putative copper resistance protein D